MRGVSRILVFTIALACPVSLLAAPQAQSAPADTTGTQNWTIDQVVTDTVSDAWHQGGETEAGFFAIVKTMAQFAAQKRDVTLPDSQEAGQADGAVYQAAGASGSSTTALSNRGQGGADGRQISRSGHQRDTCGEAVAHSSNQWRPMAALRGRRRHCVIIPPIEVWRGARSDSQSGQQFAEGRCGGGARRSSALDARARRVLAPW